LKNWKKQRTIFGQEIWVILPTNRKQSNWKKGHLCNPLLLQKDFRRIRQVKDSSIKRGREKGGSLPSLSKDNDDFIFRDQKGGDLVCCLKVTHWRRAWLEGGNSSIFHRGEGGEDFQKKRGEKKAKSFTVRRTEGLWETYRGVPYVKRDRAKKNLWRERGG